MGIPKLVTKQKMSLYSDGLFDTAQLEGSDIALIKRALGLIKKLVEVDAEKARIMDDTLKDYVNSSKKFVFDKKIRGSSLDHGRFYNGLPLIAGSLMVLGIFAITLTAAILLTIAFPPTAPLSSAIMVYFVEFFILPSFIGMTAFFATHDTIMDRLAKVIDSSQKTMEKKADKLNTYCDEAERELNNQKDNPFVSKENDNKSDSMEGFKTQYAPMFSLPDGSANNDEDRPRLLSNMTLATQARK